MLVKSATEGENLRLTNQQLSKTVDEVFEKFDVNRDNQLSFEEFKHAVLANSLRLNPLWLNATLQFGSSAEHKTSFVDQTLCAACHHHFIPTAFADRYCSRCRNLSTSPSFVAV